MSPRTKAKAYPTRIYSGIDLKYFRGETITHGVEHDTVIGLLPRSPTCPTDEHGIGGLGARGTEIHTKLALW